MSIFSFMQRHKIKPVVQPKVETDVWYNQRSYDGYSDPFCEITDTRTGIVIKKYGETIIKT